MRFKIKYPKFLLLFLIYAITITLISKRESSTLLHSYFSSISYLGTFFSGFFYAYGFTAAPATFSLLELSKHQNIFSAAFIAGVGALIGDIVIFLFIKHSFMDEIEKIKEEKISKTLRIIKKKMFGKLNDYIVPLIACTLIASPLPTEVGVTLLTSIKKLTIKKFMLLAYILHTMAIFVILLIGRST